MAARIRRMRPEAYYNHQDSAMHAAHDVEHAQMIGDTRALYHLEEYFGVRPLTDKGIIKLIARIKREDPHGIKSLILTRIVTAENPNEKERLQLLYDRFCQLPQNARVSDRVAGDFFCLAVHSKSIFDYEKGKSPWDA